MTSPAAAALYEAQHLLDVEGRSIAFFNPHGKPLDELPIIYGFNNGGSPGWYEGVLLSADGTALGGHICSSEAYMRNDLGILEGCRLDRHEAFQAHYPDGYRMEFVGAASVTEHAGLDAAYAAHLATSKAPDFAADEARP